MKCPQCHPIGADALFCERCRRPLTPVEPCPRSHIGAHVWYVDTRQAPSALECVLCQARLSPSA